MQPQTFDGAEVFDVARQKDGVASKGRLAAQMVDQDVGIDQILGQLPSLTRESLFPFLAEPSLIPAAGRQASSQQTGCLGDDAHAAVALGAPDGWERSHHPFDRLQLVLQPLDLINDTDRFHRVPPPRSVARLSEVCQCGPVHAGRGATVILELLG